MTRKQRLFLLTVVMASVSSIAGAGYAFFRVMAGGEDWETFWRHDACMDAGRAWDEATRTCKE